jgi:N-acetyl-gamma-glutamyl-phosphate/LysW-gamma-L-alpha-aminoadipyl-6-phosphate reductase
VLPLPVTSVTLIVWRPRHYPNGVGGLRSATGGGSMGKKRFGIAIAGGSGYGAGELIRMLRAHPEIEVAAITSRTHAGQPVSSVHTHLQGLSALSFQEALPLSWHVGYEGSALVCAMPSGKAAETISRVCGASRSAEMRVIDLSGDFRLTDPEQHKVYYAEAPLAPEIRSQCCYGLSELQREEIRKARIVTNPGCLATAAILSLAPLASRQFEGSVVIDAKTGTSGAGREPQASMHHPSRAHDFTAYKALQHRHEPEILQALGSSFSKSNQIIFIPHLIPTVRGIFVTAYGTTRDVVSENDVYTTFRSFYEGSPFIRFRTSPPRLIDVVGTNFCDIHIRVRGTQIVVMATLDNLGKGMVGQCIQNLNLMWGLPEETGLLLSSLGPV